MAESSQKPDARQLLRSAARRLDPRDAAAAWRLRRAAPVTALHADLRGDVLTLVTPDVGADPMLVAEDGSAVHPPAQATPDQAHPGNGLRSVRWRLDEVVAAPARLAVVVPVKDALRPLRLDTAPLTVHPAPGADDGADKVLRLSHDERGHLVVTAERRKPVSELLACRFADGAALLTCSLPFEGGDAPVLRLERDGHVVADLPLTLGQGVAHTEIGVADLPVEEGPYDVAVAVGDRRVPVVRRRNGLADPWPVILPFVLDTDGVHLAARLRFKTDGTLKVQRLPTAREEES